MESWKFSSPKEDGFHKVITTKNSDMEYGEFYRVNLSPGGIESFDTGEVEMGMTVISGEVKISVREKTFDCATFDSVYAPFMTSASMQGKTKAIVYIGAAKSNLSIQPYFVKYIPDLPIGDRHQIHGEGTSERDVFMTVGPQDKAYRLIMGITHGKEGQWTSWPPHQHSDYLEEIYCFFDIPFPFFALHLSFEDIDNIKAHKVSSGDAVIAPHGYHPTVACPGVKSTYLWMMFAKDPAEKNRRYDLAKNHPAFGDMPNPLAGK